MLLTILWLVGWVLKAFYAYFLCLGALALCQLAKEALQHAIRHRMS